MITEHDPKEAIIPLLQDLVCGFIGHPDKLEIEATRVGTILEIRLHAHLDDYPKIVGKQGKNSSALNALFNEIGNRFGLNVVIGIPDRTERQHPSNRGFVNDPKWRRAAFLDALHDVLKTLCDEDFRIKEKIVPARSNQVGGQMFHVDEASIFYIKPSRSDSAVFRREIEIAIEVIFRAIGQQQGRRLNLAFVDGTDEATNQTRPKAYAPNKA